jgi:surface protein
LEEKKVKKLTNLIIVIMILIIPSVFAENCSNGVQDINEDGIDCGGNCPSFCGSGTEFDPFIIHSCYDLYTRISNTSNCDTNSYFKLNNDLDCMNESYSPDCNFIGTLDGDYKKIQIPNITQNGYNIGGLFPQIQNTTIKKIKIFGIDPADAAGPEMPPGNSLTNNEVFDISLGGLAGTCSGLIEIDNVVVSYLVIDQGTNPGSFSGGFCGNYSNSIIGVEGINVINSYVKNIHFISGISNGFIGNRCSFSEISYAITNAQNYAIAECGTSNNVYWATDFGLATEDNTSGSVMLNEFEYTNISKYVGFGFNEVWGKIQQEEQPTLPCLLWEGGCELLDISELPQDLNSTNFYLDTNNITIKCENASVGDTGIVNGITYTKRDRDQITIHNANTTCTSGITDMGADDLFMFPGLFQDKTTFNQDISHWDTSNVTNMWDMFYGATNFNQDISYWDVSKVSNMYNMFGYAESFNQDISSWNISSVTDFTALFYEASNFNQNISSWNVSHITNMQEMFAGASSFNQGIGNWDVSSVTNMAGMFAGASSFNQNIGGWNVSKVSNMYNMFGYAESFNQNIGNWDVSNVNHWQGMQWMFRFAKNFNQDIGNWDTSNVTNMYGMFHNATSFHQDLSSWCVTNIESKPGEFDLNSDFESLTWLHPKWGTCNEVRSGGSGKWPPPLSLIPEPEDEEERLRFFEELKFLFEALISGDYKYINEFNTKYPFVLILGIVLVGGSIIIFSQNSQGKKNKRKRK